MSAPQRSLSGLLCKALVPHGDQCSGIVDIPGADGGPVQLFKTMWGRKTKFYTVQKKGPTDN